MGFRYEMDRITQDGQEVDRGNSRTLPGQTFERSVICCKCHHAFRESDVVWYDGRPYGVPCSDAKDIPSLIRRKLSGYTNRGEENRRGIR